MTIILNKATIHFDDSPAVIDFSGNFDAGMVTAVIGGDGAGKTTLLRGLAGRVSFSTPQSLPQVSGLDIGYQPADSGVWRNLSVDENIEFVSHVYRLDEEQSKQRSEKLLRSAGLYEARKRIAGDLSGGMRQKLGFILATIHQPKVVLLDEPTTGVDPASRAELWALIASSAADGATVILTTTYLDEAERANQLYLLSDGKLLASGTPDDVINETPGFIWALRDGLKHLDASQMWRRAETRYLWTRDASDHPDSVGVKCSNPDLENSVIAHQLAQESPISRANSTLPVSSVHKFLTSEGRLIHTTNIKQRFGKFTALKGVSIDVKPGEIVGLLGGNGAGKTTLMRIILGLDVPSAGTVALLGGEPSRKIRKRLGYVAQGLGLSPSLSAIENLKFAASVFKIEVDDETRKFAESFGSARVGSLSLGTQRTLAYFTAVLHQPELLVLDEPTSGMDALTRARLWQNLRENADVGVGILVTTHYMQEAAQCDRLVVLEEGEVVAAGTAEGITAATSSVVVTSSHWQEAFTLLQSAQLPVTLNGRTLRIPHTRQEYVLRALDSMSGPFEIEERPSTLEELFTSSSSQT